MPESLCCLQCELRIRQAFLELDRHSILMMVGMPVRGLPRRTECMWNRPVSERMSSPVSRYSSTRKEVRPENDPTVGSKDVLGEEMASGQTGVGPATAYARIAAILVGSGVTCSVVSIPRRVQPCTPEVAASPCHFRAEFCRDGRSLTVELSTGEPGRLPYPQVFLMQVCLDSLIVHECRNLDEWRSTMGYGALPNDVAMYDAARRQAERLAALLSPAHLELLQELTLEQLGD